MTNALIEVRHYGVTFLTGNWRADSTPLFGGGMFDGVDSEGKPVHTGLATDVAGRTFHTVKAVN